MSKGRRRKMAATVIGYECAGKRYAQLHRVWRAVEKDTLAGRLDARRARDKIQRRWSDGTTDTLAQART